MTTVYTTYFDAGYAARGLSLIQSLRLHEDFSTVVILALDKTTETLFSKLNLEKVVVLSLSELEKNETRLSEAKLNRSLVEYYFTLTPILIRYILSRNSDLDITVVYLDADLYFFDDPQLVVESLGSYSVGIIEHKYPVRLSTTLLKYGTYNVGWVGFRNTESGLACIDWWAEQCIEWCFDIPEDGKYADQGYLNQFPILFERVRILKEAGFNLAPWNLSNNSYTETSNNSVLVGTEGRLVFFHFHGLTKFCNYYIGGERNYNIKVPKIIQESVYKPYIHALSKNTELIEKLAPKDVIKPQDNQRRGIYSLSFFKQLKIFTKSFLIGAVFKDRN